jgi:monoamine oxidase
MGEQGTDIIIIGGGAAGLSAACELVRSGAKVSVLEARSRLGGRIFTLREMGVGIPIELGAEFIHGRPPAIFEIVKSAGLHAIEASDCRLLAENGKLRPVENFWDLIAGIDSQIGSDGDQTYEQFLQTADAPQFQKHLAKAYVEGFHASHADLISVKGIKEGDEAEEKIDGEKQFRIAEGYDALVATLIRALPADSIRLGCTVRAVKWSSERGIEVFAMQDDNELRFRAERLLITVPHMALRQSIEGCGGISFDPPLEAKRHAVAQLETGQAVKIVMQFREPFWEDRQVFGSRTAAAAFGFALNLDAPFPVWWTQSPKTANFLTGWAGGAQADKLADIRDLRRIALDSLRQTFNISINQLHRLFVGDYFHDWRNDAFARGAYTYLKVGGSDAPKHLAEPIDDTLFFAGEATSRDFNGTVHGALESGLRAAGQLCR